MAACDPDGKIAQMVADMHTCLVMGLHESLIEAKVRLDETLAGIEASS